MRLNGQVPQKKRSGIVSQFQNDPQCRVILMTNAGSTGLNLQSANTVINVDLPWNPAALALAGELINRPDDKAPSSSTVEQLTSRLSECVDKDSRGRPQLTISLPDEAALRSLATTLAKLLEQ